MLAANTDLEFLFSLTTTFNTQFHKLADAFLVETCEGVIIENLLILIGWQETGGVITGKTKSGLCEIVCPEGEKLSMLGYFASGDSSTRNLDHCTNCVLQLIFLEPKLFTHFSSGGVDDVLLEFKLTRIGHERHHDLREHLGALLLHLVSSLKDRLDLHGCDRRVANTEAAPPVPEHRILFVQRVDTLGDRRRAHADLLGEILLLSSIHGADKFVKRRIQKTNGGRATFE